MKAALVNSCVPPADVIVQGGIFENSFLAKRNLSRLFSKCFGNTGNSVIGYSLEKVLRECDYELEANIGSIGDLVASWSVYEPILREVRIVFLCLQDILRPDALNIWSVDEINSLIRLSEFASGRLCVLSMGANHIADPCQSPQSILSSMLPSEINHLLEALVCNSCAIQVRSLDLVAAIGDLFHSKSINWLTPGCPSYFRKGIDSVRLEKNVAKILSWKKLGQKVVAGGLFGFEAHELYGRTAYIPQSLGEILLGKRLYQDDSELNYHRSVTSLSSAYATGNINTFIGARAWERYLIDEDFLWYSGTRLHGGIMALLEGVPAVFCGGDQRTKTFTSNFFLPWRPGLLLEQAPELIAEWNWGQVLQAQAEERSKFLSDLKGLARLM